MTSLVYVHIYLLIYDLVLNLKSIRSSKKKDFVICKEYEIKISKWYKGKVMDVGRAGLNIYFEDDEQSDTIRWKDWTSTSNDIGRNTGKNFQKVSTIIIILQQ